MSIKKSHAVAILVAIVTLTGIAAFVAAQSILSNGQPVPAFLNYQGRLTDPNTGAPVADGGHTVTFRIFDADGSLKGSPYSANITTANGLFNAEIGPIDPSVFNGEGRWLEIEVDGEIFSPRQKIVSVAYAIRATSAADADTLSGKSSSEFADAGHTHGGNGGDGHSLDAADGEPTDAVFVDNEGRVGIGTMSPGNILDVRGGNVNFGDGSEQIRFEELDTFRRIAFRDLRFWDWDTAGGDMVTFNNGNVGVGTTNPRGALHLRSPLGQLYLEDSDNGKKWRITTAGVLGGLDFRYQPDEADELKDVLRLRETGNVGIGTARPSAKLDVAGTVKATAFDLNGTRITSWPLGGARANRSNDYSRPSVATDLYEGNTKLQDKYLNNDRLETIQASSPAQTLQVINNSSGHAISARTNTTTDEKAAVFGEATGTSGNTKGVIGITKSPGSASGSAAGVYGWSQSPTAIGGSAAGVLGRSWSVPVPGADTSAGVFGWGDVPSGRTYGVWGETRSTTDQVSGVYGVNIATSGMTRGTVGVVSSTTPGAAGVLGAAPNDGNNVRAVMGFCHAPSGHAIFSDGNLTVAPGYTALADSWSTRSSKRWKTNIQPIDGALDKVQRLRGVEYDRKADGGHDIGLIAEEVGAVIPEVVDYEANGVDAMSVDYSRLVPLLIEAIKAQQQEIEGLRTEISNLQRMQRTK
jgi:hypothetical protein